MNQIKHCYKCAENKPVIAFAKCRSASDGLQSSCRECQRAYAIANADRIKKRSKERHQSERGRALRRESDARSYAAHPERWVARTAVREAVKRGVIQKTTCVECGSEDVIASIGDYANAIATTSWYCRSHHPAMHAKRPLHMSRARYTGDSILESIGIGGRIGRLVVAGDPVMDEDRGCLVVPVDCDCGNSVLLPPSSLAWLTPSCGCLQRELASSCNKTHGGSKTKLYETWCGMRRRCTNPDEPGFENYGGRGITVCDEWQTFPEFRDWAQANGYRPGLTIERIDVNGHYEPGNCTWIPRPRQSANTRRTRRLVAFGEEKCMADWARDSRCAVSYGTLYQRISDGWDAERAILQPSRGPRNHKRVTD